MSFGGSSTETSTTSAPAYAQPYLEGILGEASRIYREGQKPFYPAPTNVGMSGETEIGLNDMRDIAMKGNPILAEASTLAQNTLKGDYLDYNNPYLQGAITNATNPLIDTFKTQVAPTIDSQFAGSGRYGSGLYAQARNRAEDTLTDSLADKSMDIAYKNYANERAIQDGLLNQASALSDLEYGDAKMLTDIGQVREDYAQADLDDQIAKFDAEQKQPFDFLNAYANAINSGTYGSQSSQPVSSDPFGQLVGTLVTLMNLGR